MDGSQVYSDPRVRRDTIRRREPKIEIEQEMTMDGGIALGWS